MKILFIAPRYEGGIGGHAARVAEKLREYGFEVKLLRVSSLPIKKLKNPSFALISTLRSIFGHEKFDENGYNFVIKNLTLEVLLPKYVNFYQDLMNS